MYMIMKLIQLLVCSSLLFHTAAAQTVTVLNDSTELQQFEDGQKLKVSYRLNGSPISIRDKEKLMQQQNFLRQEFNITNTGTGPAGEINFIADEPGNLSGGENKQRKTAPSSIDIFREPVGKPFPAFEWTDIKGNKFSSENSAGKTVVLNFWYTSCGPCIAELPLLNALADRYSGKNVVFIASSWNTPEQLAEFFTKYTFRYNQVASADPKTIFDPMPGWPIHIVLDGNGIVRYAVLGKQPGIEIKLEKAIEASLLNLKQP